MMDGNEGEVMPYLGETVHYLGETRLYLGATFAAMLI